MIHVYRGTLYISQNTANRIVYTCTPISCIRVIDNTEKNITPIMYCNHWHGPTAESIALDNDVVSGLLTEALFGTFCVRYRGTGYTLLLYSRHSTE